MKRIKWLIGITFIFGVSFTIFILNLTNLGEDLSGIEAEQDVLLPGFSLMSQILLLVCIVLSYYWLKKYKDNLFMMWVIVFCLLSLGWNLYISAMWIE